MFRFDVGAKVKPKLQTVKTVFYVVMERWRQECYGGAQVWYDCRMYAEERDFMQKGTNMHGLVLNPQTGELKFYRLREDELEAYDG